jgi:hypothetical protein
LAVLLAKRGDIDVRGRQRWFALHWDSPKPCGTWRARWLVSGRR